MQSGKARWPIFLRRSGTVPTRLIPQLPTMSNPILQFGTSRFLQAHVDFFVSEAARRDPARALGKITVVQTTSSADSRARVEALRAAGRYPVRIRGRRSD